MNRTDLADGWRMLNRARSAVLVEIAWRWIFGAAFWAGVYFGFRGYCADIQISPAEYSLLRALDIATWTSVTARIVVAFDMALHANGPILIAALSALWTLLASLGRATTVRALSSMAHRHWLSNFSLHLARVLLVLGCAIGFFASGGLINTTIGDPTQHLALSFVLSFFSFVFFALAWTVGNWLLSLASLFAIRENLGMFAAVARAIRFYRQNANSLFSIGSAFGVIRTIVIIVATVLSLLPIAAIGTGHVRITLLIIAAVTLVYFAIADALYLWRMAAYIVLVEKRDVRPMERPKCAAES